MLSNESVFRDHSRIQWLRLTWTVYDKDTGYSRDLKAKWNKSVNPSNIVQNSVAPVKGLYQVSFRYLRPGKLLKTRSYRFSEKPHPIEERSAQIQLWTTPSFLHHALWNSVIQLCVTDPFPLLESEQKPVNSFTTRIGSLSRHYLRLLQT